ncbi:unnamed protein product [Pieris brassicae]|uniref:C2H2-type domain-containing protein n=1 Tax=Pieris brassicae TaxID=7116 RepID=A0A9P0TMU4_PIEBR|nr:unnamed protein product [Pieris brassicae]
MDTNIMEVKQEITYSDGAQYNKICFPVLKEELKLECEVFQTCINDTFTDYNDLVLEAPRICAKCDQIFPNSFTYLQHNLTHIQVKVPKVKWLFCHRCPEKFPTKPALEKHIKKSHLKLKLHENNLKQCDVCNKIFSKKYWVHYDDGYLYPCDICGKTFKAPRRVKIHKKNSHKFISKLKFEHGSKIKVKSNEL